LETLGLKDFPCGIQHQTALKPLNLMLKSKMFGDIDKSLNSYSRIPIAFISKSGPLANAADRDHCLQYIDGRAIALANLIAEITKTTSMRTHPIIVICVTDVKSSKTSAFTAEYLEADKRSIPMRFNSSLKTAAYRRIVSNTL